MLPNLSVILSALKTREGPTWYATSMQEKTVFTIEFSCFSSQIMGICVIQEWFTPPTAFPNSINIPTPSLAEPRRLKIGLKLFKFSIVLAILVSIERKSLPYAYHYIWIGIFILKLIIPRRRSRAAFLRLKESILPWNLLRYPESIGSDRDKDKLTFVSFCDSETKCLHKSSNLMLTWHTRSPSKVRPRVMIFFCRDSL